MRTHEVLVVVRRAGEILALHRAPEGGAYWHLVAGGVEGGEDADDAAARELLEEVGLDARPARLPYDFEYTPTAEEHDRRALAAAVQVSCFAVDAPAGWEPELDWEHDEHRWCTPAAAVELLFWPEPKRAVEIATGRSS